MGDPRAPRAIVDGLNEPSLGESLVLSPWPVGMGDTSSHVREWPEVSMLRAVVPLHIAGQGRVVHTSTMQADAAGQTEVKLRRVFILLSEYFRQSRRGPDRRQLAGLVDDLVLMARDCFQAAALRYTGAADPIDAEHARCLNDLENFAQELRGRHELSSLEVRHGMDGLIVQCVLLDDQRPQAAASDF